MGPGRGMVVAMKEITVTIGGRKRVADVALVRGLLADNPAWNRSRLSRELCARWGWHGADGQLKDMACRTLLLKLERSGAIVLPARQAEPPNGARNRFIAHVPHETGEVAGGLSELVPLEIVPVAPGSRDGALCKCLLSRYHYLGLKNTVGENMTYLVRDKAGRPLACLLFGSGAWKTAPRDAFIGWDREGREAKLAYVTNNTRFLILPWVRVAHLASHVLSGVARRVSADWRAKYGHPLYLLETFVDTARFHGTCYRAANWVLLGQTKGRTRNDRDRTLSAPVKHVFVYPLCKRFREHLCR